MKKMTIYIASLLLFLACSSPQKQTHLDANPEPGYTSVLQVSTSDTETYINIIRGREAQYEYRVELAGKKVGTLKKYKTESGGPLHHWVVDKVHVADLKPDTIYSLIIFSTKDDKQVETRQFSTLNLDKKNVQFVLGSCISDHHRFKHISQEIWTQVSQLQPDFLLLAGDNVYVDSRDHVSNKKKVSTFDLWQRYFDSARETPLFKLKTLIPTLATWDDHDFGKNNADKTFHNKWQARKVFNAIFQGPAIDRILSKDEQNIYFEFKGFGQRFFLLDNRFFREPPVSTKKYGYFGYKQRQWLKSQLGQKNMPTWVAAGSQFFSPAFKLKSGQQVNESFLTDYPNSFKGFIDDLKSISSPVVFLSGDVHFSEIMTIEDSFLGYKTYELTSSPMHSYLFRANENQDEFFPNPRRLVAAKEYNFLYIDSYVNDQGAWKINVKSMGPKAPQEFFKKDLEVIR